MTVEEIMNTAIQASGVEHSGKDESEEWYGEQFAKAALKALTDAGYAVVPVEPTEAMQLAGCDVLICNDKPSWSQAASASYKAMIETGAHKV